MYDHLHVLASAPSKRNFSAFVREYTSRFSRLRNFQYRRKGQFFQLRFGSAPKLGEKKVRTAIAYLYNNPVEKKMSRYAEAYQWNFLSYAHNAHPFSKVLKLNEASRTMRRAVAEVKVCRIAETPLNYALIERITKGLTPLEIKQLTDYIVVQYNCIDYQALTNYYQDFEKMLIAIHSNTGAEHDIKERDLAGTDAIYQKMTSLIKKMIPGKDMTSILSLPDAEKMQIAWYLAAETGATPYQIAKFLHISQKEA